MGAGNSGHFKWTTGSRTKLHVGRQGKHIIGHNNYTPGKSILTLTMEEAQQLIREFAGKGTRMRPNRERVDFGGIIGYYMNPKTGEMIPTTWGIIHYSKDGAHIVPAQPQQREDKKR